MTALPIIYQSYVPCLDTEAENKQTAGQIHEAGFDSYMCGYGKYGKG